MIPSEFTRRVSETCVYRYKEMARESGSPRLSRQAEHLRHMSHMGALSLDSPDLPSVSGWGANPAAPAPSAPAAAQRARRENGNGAGTDSESGGPPTSGSTGTTAVTRSNGNGAGLAAEPRGRPAGGVEATARDGGAVGPAGAAAGREEVGVGGAEPGSELLPRPSAAGDNRQRSMPRADVGLGESSRRVQLDAGAARTWGRAGAQEEADLHAKCMAELDDEEVFGRGAQRRRERLEASPFFGEVCAVLREMGETAGSGPTLAGGVLGDLQVTRAAPPPICLQLLDEKQLVAVVRRDQARCTPDEGAGGLLASGGEGGGAAAAAGVGDGLSWEPDGVARWYARQLARSARVAVISRLHWRQWGASRRRRELGERLRAAARGVAPSGGGRHGRTGAAQMLGGRAAVA